MMHRNATVRTHSAPSVADRAIRFADTLDDAQRHNLFCDHTFANAARWSNYPDAVLGRHGRVGLRTSTLTSPQWDALFDLLAVATGSGPDAGVDAIRGHLDADDLLLARGGRHGYGRGHFCVAFLGAPGRDRRWQLQFGGHHLAVSNTYVDDVLVGATPSFRGIEPFSVGGRRRGARLEQDKQRAVAALLASFDEGQRRAARLSGRHHDLLLGPGDDWSFTAPEEGLPGADLRPDQGVLLLTAIDAWVHDVADDAAERILTRYATELDRTRVAFSGSITAAAVGDYVRIDGPSVWIEFSMHEGVVLPGVHPHTVWRDKVTDYGGLRPGGRTRPARRH